MKRFILTIVSISSITLPIDAELDIQKIDFMVQKIKSKRVAKHIVDFNSIKSPFVIIKSPNRDKNETVAKIIKPANTINFELGAIVNERAFINGKWVSVGDIIGGYKVENISDNEVDLKKEDKRIRIFLPPLHKNLNLLQISEG